MPSVILRPNAAAVGTATGGGSAPTIVGSGAQLGDQSDATYATVTAGPGAAQNWVDAPFEPLTIDPAWVTSVVAHGRFSSATTPNAPTLRWLNGTVSFTHPILYVDASLGFSSGGSIVEVSATVADVASGTYFSTWTMLQAATYLTGSDVYVEVQALNASVTAYDVWLEVFYTPLSTVAPPCQLYPRDDDQGAGSAAVWPPPSSSRPGSYY